jgi:hypothetical protein
VGIGALSGFSSFFVAGGIMSALGNPAWAIPYAAAAGGAAGGIVGSALSGGNIGQAAAAGAVGGAIGSVMPIIGPMIGSGVASEMVGGNFLEGAAQGAACVISSAIASGALQTAIDYGRNIEEKSQINKIIAWQRANDPNMLMGGWPDSKKVWNPVKEFIKNILENLPLQEVSVSVGKHTIKAGIVTRREIRQSEIYLRERYGYTNGIEPSGYSLDAYLADNYRLERWLDNATIVEQNRGKN